MTLEIILAQTLEKKTLSLCIWPDHREIILDLNVLCDHSEASFLLNLPRQPIGTEEKQKSNQFLAAEFTRPSIKICLYVVILYE